MKRAAPVPVWAWQRMSGQLQDLIDPSPRVIGPAYADLEERLTPAIGTTFGLSPALCDAGLTARRQVIALGVRQGRGV